MSERERQPPGGTAQAIRSASVLSPSASSDNGPASFPTWDAIYGACTVAQQRELLALAQRQGVLYGHQVPPQVNGPPREEARRFLTRLFDGNGAELVPAPASALDAPLLHPSQRAA